ncbi:MAG: VWA domain-containing protein [Opitutales bacterium]|nr:VWA domain-containing protein [Opitutales bacterium]MCH8539487.1 VWA domain-containing protein [Opitutales bacterium]
MFDKTKSPAKSVSFLLGVFLLCTQVSLSAGESELRVIGTINTSGQILGEARNQESFGNFANRAHLLTKKKQEGPLLLIDGGNLFFGSGSFSSAPSILARGYQQLEYDVVNLSFGDFRRGKEVTMALIEEHELPATSANLFAEDGRELFPPYRIIEKGTLRIGVLGLSPRPWGKGPKPVHLRNTLKGIKVGDPVEALETYLPQLSGETDHVVVAWPGDAVSAKRILGPYADRFSLLLLPGDNLSDFTLEVPLLAPLGRGRELGQGMFSGGSFQALEPLHIDSGGPEEESIGAALTKAREALEERQQKAREGVVLPKALPEVGELVPVFRQERHQGLSMRVFNWKVIEHPREEGQKVLVVEVSLANSMAARLVQNLDFAEAVHVATLNNKAFVVADNRVVLRHGQISGLEGQLPDHILIPEPGQGAAGKLAFPLPEGDWRRLELVLMHDEFPPLEILLLDGEAASGSAEEEAQSNEVLQAWVPSWDILEEWKGRSAPEGKKWVMVDLWGHSLMGRMGESAALDARIPTAENEQVEHLVPMEYFYFPDTVALELSGERFIPWDRELSEFGEVPVFLPHRSTGATLVFAVPEDLTDESLALRAWFPSMALAGDGSYDLTTPDYLRFPLQDGESIELPEPLFAMEDSPLRLEVLAMERIPSPDGAVLSLLLRSENHGEEAGLLPLDGRFGLFVDHQRYPLSRSLTLSTDIPPTEQLYLPPGEARVYEIKIPFPDDATEALFDYRGVSSNQRVRIDLGAEGAAPDQSTLSEEEAEEAATGLSTPGVTLTEEGERQPSEVGEVTAVSAEDSSDQEASPAAAPLDDPDLPEYLRVETFVPTDPLLEEFTGSIRVRDNPRIETDYDLDLEADIVPSLHISEKGEALDMGDWWMEGWLKHADWIAADDGSYVLQRENHFMPAFLIYPEPVQEIEVVGRMGVFDHEDDDHIGLVMGLQAPLREKGRHINQHDYILFSWNHSGKRFLRRTGRREGLELHLVRGVDKMTEEHWERRVEDRDRNHLHTPHWRNYTTDHLKFIPLVEHGDEHELIWEPDVLYTVRLSYGPEHIRIALQGGERHFAEERVVFDVSIDDVPSELFPEGHFPKGHFGFYNNSQEMSYYESFHRESFPSMDAPATVHVVPPDLPVRPYYLIFDSSGTMRAPMEGKPKYQVVQEAINQFVKEVPDGSDIRLRAFGHTKRPIEDGADEDSEEIYRTRSLNDSARSEIARVLESIEPRGRSVLTYSLEQALRDVRRARRNIPLLILLTDGADDRSNRRADPVPVAAQIGERDNVDFAIVGFDIPREPWRQRLESMASVGKAQLFPADSPEDLKEAILEAGRWTGATLLFFDETGEKVARMSANESQELPPGVYTIHEEQGGEVVRKTERWLRPGMEITIPATLAD